MLKDSHHTATKEKWEHVYQCPQCGHIVKAEEIPRPAIISGVMTCPQCESSGPINVQIIRTNSHRGAS